MDAERLEVGDMCRGIAKSGYFLLYLTKRYFSRWFCRLEASVECACIHAENHSKLSYVQPACFVFWTQVAKALGKELVVVYESDPRHHGNADYLQLAREATKKYPQ